MEGLAQNTNNNKLKIGDTLPNLPLTNLYNYKGPEKNLGDFKGKLLILDFWATWCGPCIAAFPKMEALREKFKGKLQILPVTNDSEQKVKELFTNLKTDQGLDMFSVVADKQIAALFNFNKIPHYVWIDQQGKYLGDATQEDMTEEKISLAISGKEALSKEATVARSVDGMAPLMNITIPMIENGEPKSENIDTKILRSSTFTRSVEGIGAGLRITKNRFTARNNELGTMLTYVAAFELNDEGGLYSNQFYFFNTNRTIWEVSDKALLDYGPRMSTIIVSNSPGWKTHRDEHTFCYELKLGKDTSYKYVAKVALLELNQRFKQLLNISAYIEKRKIKCLVLKRTSSIDKVAGNSDQLQPIKPSGKTERFSLSVVDRPYIFFIMPLVTQHLGNISTPIVDETGFDLRKVVNIQLEGKLNNWENLNTLLVKYDLAFEEADRTIDMVIITDKSTQPIQ